MPVADAAAADAADGDAMPLIDILAPLCAYLLGSISFAWIVARLHGVDLRQHGSGNLGATNVGRVLGGPWFVVVFLADIAKGLLPVLTVLHIVPLAQLTLAPALLGVATGLGAVLGHVFPCYHGFRGGKAVATSLGVCVGLAPLVAAVTFGVWSLVYGIGVALKQGRSGAVGPASILAAPVAPIAQILIAVEPWGRELPITCLLLLLAVLILIRHRRNIAALLRHGRDDIGPEARDVKG
ncbi:MAG: glycerol-3-phosphate 1-O-acyltransferase PlsY [Planctomycetota bacterium]